MHQSGARRLPSIANKTGGAGVGCALVFLPWGFSWRWADICRTGAVGVLKRFNRVGVWAVIARVDCESSQDSEESANIGTVFLRASTLNCKHYRTIKSIVAARIVNTL